MVWRLQLACSRPSVNPHKQFITPAATSRLTKGLPLPRSAGGVPQPTIPSLLGIPQRIPSKAHGCGSTGGGGSISVGGSV